MGKVRCRRNAAGELVVDFLHNHGGARAGAGRRPTRPLGSSASERRRAGVAHRRRTVERGLPLHVTTRTVPAVGRLRRHKLYQAIRRALVLGCYRRGFRVCQFSVQEDRLHLVVEADDSASLHRGMTGLLVRIARGLNRLGARRGQVFPDRYQHRVLRNPGEVRRGLCYVLNNVRRRAVGAQTMADSYSSAAYFDGWARAGRTAVPPPDEGPPPVAPPRTWLLSAGWRAEGLLAVTEVPSESP